MKQKILAEIERLKQEELAKKDSCKRSGLQRIVHHIGAYNNVLNFINSLPEEPREPKEYDLVKFADWQSIEYRNQRESCGLKDPITLDEVEEANYAGIMAGAQWQKRKDIDKACEAFCKAECDGHPPRSTCTSLGTCKKYDDFRKSMED